jgi:hypothetical protein
LETFADGVARDRFDALTLAVQIPDTLRCVSRIQWRRQESFERQTFMAKMKAVQVSKAGGEFELVEREVPQPGPGQVRIKVQACGVCFSDHLTKDGIFPGIQYPRVPGHEVAGVVVVKARECGQP